MEKISIISKDARFLYANSLFSESGYESEVLTASDKRETDIIIFPVRDCLTKEQLYEISQNFRGVKAVFSGAKDKCKDIFDAKIYDYSQDEVFIDENAYLTAESALQIALENLEKSLSDSKIAILGYGRIGSYLTKMLVGMKAKTFVYARREISVSKAKKTGAKAMEIEDINRVGFDIVFNTVPNPIVSKDVTDKAPKNTVFIELASKPGGFYDTSRVTVASALPGKYFPKSAGKAIFDFVVRTLCKSEA